MLERDADAAIQGATEAILHPEAWPVALATLAQACRSPLAFGQITGADRYSGFANPESDGFLEDYIKNGWHLCNPRMKRGLEITRSGFSDLITLDHSFSDEELARQPFQQEFAKRYGVDCEAGMVLAKDVDTQFILTLQRSGRIGPYRGEELRRMNQLMKRLKTACQQALTFRVEGIAGTKSLVDATGEALAFLSWTGRIIGLSRAFEASYPQHFRYRNGRLHMASRSDDRRLQAALSTALRTVGAEAQTEVFLQEEGSPLVVHITPVLGSPRDLLGSIRAIVSVPRYQIVSPQNVASVLRKSFSLTESEIRLTMRLAKAETLIDAAADEKISVETARTRLKSIFRKTGTHRQLDLVLLVEELMRL